MLTLVKAVPHFAGVIEAWFHEVPPPFEKMSSFVIHNISSPFDFEKKKEEENEEEERRGGVVV